MDFQLRNVYNKDNVTELSKSIQITYKEFDKKGFEKYIFAKLEQLNFGDRAKLITEALHEFLPKDYKTSIQILIDSLRHELKVEPGKTDWNAFIIVPQTEYVAKYGMEHFDLSLKALYEMTKRFSSEGAIRAFITKYNQKTINLLHQWTSDTNVHVRRLVSEGTRPRLPLSTPLKIYQKDPRPVIELLDKLKDDKELYVRRSVANNLNDIAKDNPKIVVETLKRWQANSNPNRDWVIKHSLRTLVKQGYNGALSLLGYQQPEIKVSLQILTPTIKVGDTLKFVLNITSHKDQNLLIDYLIHFVKANTKLSAKVFKITTKKIKESESIQIEKSHPLRIMTTRKLYMGTHYLQLQINGHLYEKVKFELNSE